MSIDSTPTPGGRTPRPRWRWRWLPRRIRWQWLTVAAELAAIASLAFAVAEHYGAV